MNNKIDLLKTDYENKLNEIEKKNDNLEKKNEDLESKLGQFQDDQKDLESKLGQFQDEMNNNIADNRIRVEHLEGEKSISRNFLSKKDNLILRKISSNEVCLQLEIWEQFSQKVQL